jgi:two-component system nitrate/nitrite response regulator NarL
MSATREDVLEPVRAVRAPSVVVVDDQPLFRDGLTAMLRDGGLDVVGEVDDLRAARAVLRVLSPDVVLVALDRWGDRLPEVVRALSSASAPPGVVGVLGYLEERLVRAALDAGLHGCVLRGSPPQDHVLAVRAASRGERFVADGVPVRFAREADGAGSRPRLTPRERDVLRLLVRGWDNGRIARALYLSRTTVKHHVSAVLHELHVDNRVQAAVRAIELGLLD